MGTASLQVRDLRPGVQTTFGHRVADGAIRASARLVLHIGSEEVSEDFYHEGGFSGLRTGGAALVLKASEKGSSGVMLVFACNDIDLSLHAAAEQGATITHPVTDGHWGAKIAGFEDPEGNSLFLEQPTESKEHSLTE